MVGCMSGGGGQACHHLVSFWPPKMPPEMALRDARLTITSFTCSLQLWLILDCHQCKCHLLAGGLCVLSSCASHFTSVKSMRKSQAWDGLFRSSPGSRRCPFLVHHLETHLGLLAQLGGHYKCSSCCPASPPSADSQCHLHVKWSFSCKSNFKAQKSIGLFSKSLGSSPSHVLLQTSWVYLLQRCLAKWRWDFCLPLGSRYFQVLASFIHKLIPRCVLLAAGSVWLVGDLCL